MRQSILSLSMAGCVALLAGCGSMGMSVGAAPDYVTNSAKIVKAANWDQMQKVTIELSDHDFEPKHLKLKANQPYLLVIKNTGEADHYYTAEKFFKSVAWRKAMSARPHGGEFKAPYFTAVEAFKKGGTIELYFVTGAKGSYEVVCTIDDHKDKGMTGSITVE